MTLEEFEQRFALLKARDEWIKSLRRGPTGIGHTFEQVIGLGENNLATPDLVEVEIKTHRVNSTSIITLFTFNKKAWRINPIEAVRKYGVPDDQGRLGVYYTLTPTPNSKGLFIHLDSQPFQSAISPGKLWLNGN
jgi:hypothetical protein